MIADLIEMGGDASITIASSDNGVSVRPKPKFPSKK